MSAPAQVRAGALAARQQQGLRCSSDDDGPRRRRRVIAVDWRRLTSSSHRTWRNSRWPSSPARAWARRASMVPGRPDSFRVRRVLPGALASILPPHGDHREAPVPGRCPRRPRPGRRLAAVLRRAGSQRPPLLRPGVAQPRPRRPARSPLAADPPQPVFWRTGLIPLLRSPARQPRDPGQDRRTPVDDGRELPGRQDPDRPGRPPGSHLDLLVPADHPGHPRQRLTHPRRRGRTRRPAPARPDPAHPQQDRAPPRRHLYPPHHHVPALVPMAPPPPVPLTPLPLPTASSPAIKITIYGWSTSEAPPLTA